MKPTPLTKDKEQYYDDYDVYYFDKQDVQSAIAFAKNIIRLGTSSDNRLTADVAFTALEMAFPVFVDDSHSSGEVSGVVSGTQSQPTPLNNPYERFDCGHMQCTECEFHCNPDDFIVRESTERVFDECFDTALSNLLSQPSKGASFKGTNRGNSVSHSVSDSWKDSTSLSQTPTEAMIREVTLEQSDGSTYTPIAVSAATESVATFANCTHEEWRDDDGDTDGERCCMCGIWRSNNRCQGCRAHDPFCNINCGCKCHKEVRE